MPPKKTAAPKKGAATKVSAASKKKAPKATTQASKKAAKPAATRKPAATGKPTARSTATKRRRDDDDDDDEDVSAPTVGRPKKAPKLNGTAAPGRAKANGTARRTARSASASASVSAPINTRPVQKLNVFVFGEGRFGELGLGNQKHEGKKPINVKRPRINHNLLADKVGVVQVACGGMHAVALTADNKILTWGVNDLKALGRDPVFEDPGSDNDSDASDDDDDYRGLDLGESNPGEIDLSAFKEVPQWVQVTATDSATFALTETGDVYGWGTFKGSEGVLGFSKDVVLQSTPVQVAGLKNITSLAAGTNHMLALDKDGKVFTWGHGGEFQLGWKPASRHAGPKATLEPHVCGRFTKSKHAVKIAAGSYHSFYIDNHGKLHSWGLNNFSQTGHSEHAGQDNAIITTVKAVRALRDYEIVHVDGGEHHSVACSADGKLFTWGRIDSHQVGLPTDSFTEDNSIMGANGKPRILVQPTVIPNVPASFAAAGTDTTIAITPDGEAYSWGFSENYQTGLGTTDDVEIPTIIDNTAVRDEKLVWAGCGGQYSMLASTQ